MQSNESTPITYRAIFSDLNWKSTNNKDLFTLS
jgi:hypothetical protein